MRRAVVASSVFVSCLSLLHCGGSNVAPKASSPPPALAVTAGATAAPAAPLARDDGRLPSLATPVRYAIALDVDPNQPRFTGRATIMVDVAASTRHLVLHARDMSVTSVVAHTTGGDVTATAAIRPAHGGAVPQELVLTFAAALPAGRATIEIAYEAPFASDLSGLYRVKEGERWYAYTQFESTDARRAFPCFDEPSFKVPFELSIKTPRDMIALANTAETTHRDEGAKTRFDFAPTPPLPSYLVAFAIGDFDVRSGSTSPVPIRLITVKGKAQLGDLALDATHAIVDKLGDYFGMKYPFSKLDIVAVPDFAAGAMENPGLVTFREELLLQEAGRASAPSKQRQALVIAHELAHIWFGDLVTTAWWNDVWLNEGFATWMEAKIVDAVDPRFEARIDGVMSTQRVMDLDALTSARAIREPVSSTSEVVEQFDPLTYQKGAAVLGMIEHWLGAETFQKGVRAYITAHAWKNAKAEDLLGALDAASGRDVSALAATFLDRSGVPSVAVRSTCANGASKVELTQTAWHPLGVEPKAAHGPWRIPVCVESAVAKGAQCTDLTTETGVLNAQAATCPAWSYPNAGQAGYYRASLAEKDIHAIALGHKGLDVESRIGFVANVWAQVRSGELEAKVLFDTLPAFDDENDRQVVEKITEVLEEVDNELIDDASHPGFKAYVAARLAKQKAKLGWTPKGKEEPSRALLRKPVLLALGMLAEDPATLKEAETLAKKWLANPKSVDPDAAEIAMLLASRQAGVARVDEIRAAIAHAATPQDRVTALTALGGFAAPDVLRRAFDLILTDDVKRQDVRYLLKPVLAHRGQSLVLFGWLKEHWDAFHTKLPGGLGRKVMDVTAQACTKEEHEDAKAFFTPLAHDMPGASRPFAEALDQSSACIALRGHAAESIAARFGKGPTSAKKM